MKKLAIVICVMIVVLAILIASAILLFTVLLRLPSARGLQLNPMYMHTNYEKFPIVENNGKETVYISRFHDENNDTIKASHEFWNGWFYELPSGKYISLTMDGLQFYSHEIYVEFLDGYECKLGNIH